MQESKRAIPEQPLFQFFHEDLNAIKIMQEKFLPV